MHCVLYVINCSWFIRYVGSLSVLHPVSTTMVVMMIIRPQIPVRCRCLDGEHAVDSCLAPALDHRCDLIHDCEGRRVVWSHFCKDTVASVRRVEVRVLAEVDEALRVATCAQIVSAQRECSEAQDCGAECAQSGTSQCATLQLPRRLDSFACLLVSFTLRLPCGFSTPEPCSPNWMTKSER